MALSLEQAEKLICRQHVDRAYDKGRQAGRAQLLASLKAWVQSRRDASDVTTLGQIERWIEQHERASAHQEPEKEQG